MLTRRSEAGQTLAELGIVMPLLLLLAIGVLEVGWTLFQSNTIRNYVRESSNLISRARTFQEAEQAIVSASSVGGPVRIGVGEVDSRMILSVVTRGAAGVNANQVIVLQRHQIGDLNAESEIQTSGGTYGGAPDYVATDPENDTGLRVSGALPNGYVLPAGQSLFVTEIFTRRDRS
jgi:Flp pilus assembly protein TadG